MQLRTLIALLMGVALTTACSQQSETTPSTSEAGAPQPSATARENTPEAHAKALQTAQSAKPTAAINTGIVKEAKSAGGYSYLHVNVGGNDVWIAATQAQVKPGDVVSWGDYAVMRNFTSKALNQTFPVILFVSKVVPGNMAPPPANKGKVLSVANGGGYSYLEVQVNGGKEWLAAPQTNVKVGDQVSWSGGSAMTNFSSKSLDRTFDKILFVAGVNVAR
ncbi:MAG: hypothetical protein Kow006_09520 [Gammaproteobacteria bacterium]